VQWNENQMKLDFAVLRNTQGMYAPLHLKCELDVAKRVNAVAFGVFSLCTKSYRQMLDTCRLRLTYIVASLMHCLVTASETMLRKTF